MTESGDDFEAFLKRRTVLPNGMSDEDKLEPPRALDARVLKQAREAVREQQRLNRAPRWAIPVALAATILLCLSVVLNVSLNTNRPAAERSRLAVASADKAPAARDAEAAPAAVPGAASGGVPTPGAVAASAPSAGAARAAAALSAAAEGERRGNAASAPGSDEAILPEAKVAEPRAPRPPVLAESATPTSVEALRAETPRPHGSAVDKAAAFAARSGTVGRGDTARADSLDTATADSRDAAAASSRDGTTMIPSQQAAGASRNAELAARRSAPARSTESASGNAAPPAKPDPTPQASAPSDIPLAERQDTHQPALAKGKASTAPSPSQDPKAWLHRINALRAEGKTDQANAEMRRFRATFPGYPANPVKPDSPAADAPR